MRTHPGNPWSGVKDTRSPLSDNFGPIDAPEAATVRDAQRVIAGHLADDPARVAEVLDMLDIRGRVP